MRIINADVFEGLLELDDNSVNCVVTSPPYFGLRDYGVHGQIGLESTHVEYIVKMVSVFRQVRRVLREDGTMWVNIGDSYCGSWGAQGHFVDGEMVTRASIGWDRAKTRAVRKTSKTGSLDRTPGLKTKDLMMIPARLAIALQDDGWYLRSDIIWHKPNPMPESVTDRPTKSHEYVFLLTKSEHYLYDAEAIKEPATDVGRGGYGREEDPAARPPGSNPRSLKRIDYTSLGRNKRSVWTVPTQPYPDAHFATFPEALIEPCVKAGCPKDGVVLDPFGGSGTTAVVARRMGCNAILIEINEAYCAMAAKRLSQGVLELQEATA